MKEFLLGVISVLPISIEAVPCSRVKYSLGGIDVCWNTLRYHWKFLHSGCFFRFGYQERQKAEGRGLLCKT